MKSFKKFLMEAKRINPANASVLYNDDMDRDAPDPADYPDRGLYFEALYNFHHNKMQDHGYKAESIRDIQPKTAALHLEVARRHEQMAHYYKDMIS